MGQRYIKYHFWLGLLSVRIATERDSDEDQTSNQRIFQRAVPFPAKQSQAMCILQHISWDMNDGYRSLVIISVNGFVQVQLRDTDKNCPRTLAEYIMQSLNF